MPTGARRGKFAALVALAISALAVMALPLEAWAEKPCFIGPASTEDLMDASWNRGSTYVPVDSWLYGAMDRLHSLGYLDDAYLGMRPWTRLTMARMVQASADKLSDQQDELVRLTQLKDAMPGGAGGEEAQGIIRALQTEFAPDLNQCGLSGDLDSTYAQVRGIAGTPLRDSYHIGQTLVNDYGRPYEGGVNAYVGSSERAQYGRFALYVRGEYQHAPSATGYSQGLFDLLSQQVDLIPVATNPVQATIPLGPIGQTNRYRILEANASYRVLGHEISFGKSDHWMGPGQGGAFAYSNNAENIYAFQIDRTDPLHVPLLSDLIGPVRYDFFVGSLKGHTAPEDPWVHVEKISFKPTRNTEFGFERTVIWGGQGHVPITVHSFLKSFFSFQNVSVAEKNSRNDPGARFGSFDFEWRLPFLRDWVTLYTDSLSHDDVSPISAPRRAAIRPGLYLSHVPGLPKMDLRVEAATTDPPVSNSNDGGFLEFETVQRQGLTNEGFLFGDPTGREDKGGNAWLTYHLSPKEQVQVSWRGVKAAKDFIPGGTTQNQFRIDATKQFGAEKQISAHVWAQYEGWKAPVYKMGGQSDTAIAAEVTWWPGQRLHY